MKTTVEIRDTLLDEARKVAARQDTTLRALIVEGLRRIIRDFGRFAGLVCRNPPVG